MSKIPLLILLFLFSSLLSIQAQDQVQPTTAPKPAEQPVENAPGPIKPKKLSLQEIRDSLLDPKKFTFVGDKKLKKAIILSPGGIYQWGKHEKLRIPNQNAGDYNLLTWNEFQELFKGSVVVYKSDTSAYMEGMRISYIKNNDKWKDFVKKNSTKLIIVEDSRTKEPAYKYYIRKN